MAESWEEKLQIFENLLSFFFFFSPRFLSNNGQNRNWASMFFWGEEDCSSDNNNNNSCRWSGENSVLTSSSLFFSAKKREKFLIPSSRLRTYLARSEEKNKIVTLCRRHDPSTRRPVIIISKYVTGRTLWISPISRIRLVSWVSTTNDHYWRTFPRYWEGPSFDGKGPEIKHYCQLILQGN